MTERSHRETETATDLPAARRARSVVIPAVIVIILLGSVCLVADPTIYHDARGDFASWHLAYDLGREELDGLAQTVQTVHDDAVYELGMNLLWRWRVGLVVSYIFSILATMSLFADRRAFVRIAAYSSFAVFSTVLFTYQQFGMRFSPAVAGLMLSEAGTANEYVPLVMGAAMKFVLLVLVLLLGVRYLARRFLPEVRTRFGALAAALVLASTVWISMQTNGVVTNSSPLFKVPAAFIVNRLLQATLTIPERQAVFFDKRQPAKATNVVMLIDESVTADYLQINGFRLANTPLLSGGSIDLFNFGDAASVYSFTEYSHQLLQSGIRIEQLPDYDRRIYSLPSIFQYAKHAGFDTAFVDGHYNSHKHVRNPIVQETDHVKYIDFYVSLGEKYGGQDYRTDYRLVDEVIDRLDGNRGRSNLIYAFKQGLHIPFGWRYPETERVFRPTLQGSEWSPEKTLESLNSYCNGVLWSVDSLLRYLVHGLASRGIEDTVVVYTSDHANRQHFGGVEQVTEYYSVPFMIFPVGIADDLRSEIHAASLFNKDRVSHVDVFPSILVLMGYAKDEVNRRYGHTIFDYLGARRRTVFDGDIFGVDGDVRVELPAADSEPQAAGAPDLSVIFGAERPPPREN